MEISKKDIYIKYGFYFILLSYGILFLVNSAFGITDDHEFTNNLLINKPLPFFIQPSIGRYYPLDAQEYNIISYFSTSPTLFYSINLFQFLVVVYLLKELFIIVLSDKYKNLVYLVVLAFVFSPAFTTAWFRLFVPERGALFFLLLFLLYYVKFQKNTENYFYFFFSLLFGTIALYYKEPIFIMLGSFVVIHLILGWKELNIKQKILDIFVAISSFIWLLNYYFIVFIHRGEHLYHQEGKSFFQLIKLVINSILNDPFIMILVFVFIVYRYYDVIFNHKKIHLIYDSLLISSFLYVSAIFILGLGSGFYYFLPSYAFSIIAILYFLINEKYISKLLIKYIVGLSFLIYILNSLPQGLSNISFWKNVPLGYQKSLQVLSKELQNRNKHINILVDYIPENQYEVIVSIKRFLKYYEVDENKYSIYTNRKQIKLDTIDYIYVLPFSKIDVNVEYYKNIETRFKEIFEYKPEIYINNYSFRIVVKYFVLKYNINNHIFQKDRLHTKSEFYIFKNKSNLVD